MKQTIKVADKPTADEIKATVEGNASKLDGITTYLESGGGRLSENSNGVKFSPTDNEKIDVNCQYIFHFDTENYNKNGIESHQALVFRQSGGGVS